MNTSYHYSLEGKPLGPVTLEQLKGLNITKETLVWKEGLSHWVQAGELEELEGFFKALPPPLEQTVPPPIQSNDSRGLLEDDELRKDRQNKILIWSGIVIGILLFIVLIANIGKSKKSGNEEAGTADSTSTEYETMTTSDSLAVPMENVPNQNTQTTSSQPKKAKKQTEDDIREELYNKEVSNPKKHLYLEYQLKYKVLSGKDEITGTVYNNATIAGFKDVVLKIEYKSETSSILKTEYYTIYKYIYAYESVPFTIKTYSPSGTRYIGVDISSAENAY